ncbi:hypothetical protein [Rhizobium ruizarguesonis]
MNEVNSGGRSAFVKLPVREFFLSVERMDVNYYLVTRHGRSKMNAKTDVAALSEAEAHRERYPGSTLRRVVKETKEILRSFE